MLLEYGYYMTSLYNILFDHKRTAQNLLTSLPAFFWTLKSSF